MDSDYFSVMNVLMSLRKVCNHPDLFKPRDVDTPISILGSEQMSSMKNTLPPMIVE